MSNLDNGLLNAIINAAKSHGINPNYLVRTAEIESGGNPNAKNPNSTAGGLFQFTDSTARQYGLNDKFDPIASANAAAQLARDNASFLRNRLGREPTDNELYLAHQQGAKGALDIILNPNKNAGGIVGEVAIRNNGGNPNMSAKDFSAYWANKFNNNQTADNGQREVQQQNNQSTANKQNNNGLAEMPIVRIFNDAKNVDTTGALAQGAGLLQKLLQTAQPPQQPIQPVQFTPNRAFNPDEALAALQALLHPKLNNSSNGSVS